MNPRPFTILIVSPDRLSLRRLSKFLDVFGYDVRQATDGERAGARFIEYERRLAEQAAIDSLTGLADKAALIAELHRRSQGAKGAIGWLAVFDLDYFQRITDRVGRCGAQDLLRQVAQHVQSRS